MDNQASIGAALVVVLGGLIHGSWALPMKRITKWKWENMWLVYSVVGLIIIPPLLAYLAVPALGTLYGNTAASTLGAVAAFGFGWGLGSILFGLGIARVGMALGFSIILGITSSFGSLLPLLALDPSGLFTRKGYILLAGLAVAIAGIVVVALAGAQRDRDQNPNAGSGQQAGFTTGLIICIASGILSPALNFGFVFGKPVVDAAVAMGANKDFASNVVWAPALAGGFIANAGYAVYLLIKNKSWGAFTQSGTPVWYWLGASAMGLMWFGGIATYGLGATALGPLGAVVGWPMFMSVVIVTANIWGAITGEWKGASGKARARSWLGIAILIAAIIVVSFGS